MAKRSSSGKHRIGDIPTTSVSLARSGLDSLLEGCQIVGYDWTYLYVNDALLAQAKRTRAELLGRTMMEVYAGIESAPFFSHLRECMRERRPQSMENEFRYPDGSTGWFELRMEPVPEGVLVLSIDVTALRSAEQRFRRLLESAPVAIFVQTRGRFAYLNPAAARLFGAESPQALLDEPVLEHFAPELQAAITQRIRRLNEAREPVEAVEEVIVRADASRVPVEVSAVPLSYEGEDGALVFATDLTERQRAEAERVRLEAQFRQAQKMEAIGRLAGGIAHDFNNMLSVVLGCVDLALAREEASPPLRADLSEVRQAAESAARLTRQLLALSRREVPTPAVLDLNDELRRIENLLRRLLGEDVELELRLAPELGRIEGDPSQLEQVILNLAVNSRDAMPRGGRLVVETRDVDLDAAYAEQHLGVTPGPHVMLAVSDDGVGMDAATRERLFEPFFTTKQPGEGTGLGLATVYGIVQQCRGCIWVYSEPGQGTTFRIYLPRASGDRPVVEVAAGRPSRGGDETVLVVEDQPALRSVFERILSAAGYRVHAAGDGREALRLVAQGVAPQLLLTDVVMPGMDGPELVGRLRGELPELRVLFMSGYSEESVSRHGALATRAAFIGKPFAAVELVQRVRDALDG